MKIYKPKSPIIPEEPQHKEAEKEETEEEEEMTRERFKYEIDLIHKYLTFEFKATDFSSQILLDAFAN